MRGTRPGSNLVLLLEGLASACTQCLELPQFGVVDGQAESVGSGRECRVRHQARPEGGNEKQLAKL